MFESIIETSLLLSRPLVDILFTTSRQLAAASCS